MQKHIGAFWALGFFAMLATANAQTPSPAAATTKFDGTYAFVSSTKVNETSRDFHNRERQCDDRIAGPLTIVSGRAKYSGFRGFQTPIEFEGTIGQQGELRMRAESIAGRHSLGPTVLIITNGGIDGNGTARARQMGYRCSYDFVWQKQ